MSDNTIPFPLGKSLGRSVVKEYASFMEKAETPEERRRIQIEFDKFVFRVFLLKLVLDKGFDPKEFLIYPK